MEPRNDVCRSQVGFGILKSAPIAALTKLLFFFVLVMPAFDGGKHGF